MQQVSESQRLAVQLGQRLREARGPTARADLALALGVHENTIGKFERGDSVPDAVQLLQLARITGQSVDWLIGGAVVAVPSAVPVGTQAVQVGDLIHVPRFDVQASAGHGALGATERVVGMRAFDADYIRRELGICHNDLALVTVVGDSMSPDMRSGDMVLIDRRDTSVSTEGPHLVRIDGALLLKLLQRRPGGMVRVASRNEVYAPYDISLSAGEDFQVLGRVRWVGVTYR